MSNIPKTMRAMVLVGNGGLDKLEYHQDWPVPQPTENQVLVKILACGLNNTDINTRVGWYSKSVTEATSGEEQDLKGDNTGTWGGAAFNFPRIQGADVCGEIVAFGNNISHSDQQRLSNTRVLIDTWVRDWNNPENIETVKYFGSEVDGGYAEYTAIDFRQVHPIKSELSNEQLATFATSWVTAENMLDRTPNKKGEWILVTGASGGVGSALIQLAKLRHLNVVAVSNPNKHQAVKAIGADAVLATDEINENLAQTLTKSIGRNTVHIVADGVGGPSWKHLIEIIHRGGYYTCCGGIAGPIVDFDLRTFYLNNLTFIGATQTRPHTFKNLVGYIQQSRVKPVLGGCYSLENLHQAQKDFLAKKHVGNLVLKIAQD